MRTHSRHLEKTQSHICIICQKTFSAPRTLKTHMKTHEGEIPQTSSISEKEPNANFQEFLANSTPQNSQKLRPYTCNICEKGFITQGDLTGHMRTHSNNRPYTCVTCEKVFKRKGDLNIHMRRTHNDDKPYTCNVCAKMFKKQNSLNKHMQVGHDKWKPSEQRPFTCFICGRGFKKRKYVKRHMLLHN